MTNFLKKKKTAFTLIELLVVIAIIGILSTLAVVAIQSARSKARDSKRIADVKQMQTALELYFNDNGSYPTSITSTIATAGVVYMTSVPSAPTPADGSCSTTTNAYTYTSNGSTYTITFCVGGQTANLPAGQKIATRDGVSSYTPPDACGNNTSMVDARDGKTYSIVAIGNQCWMSQNMNYNSGCASNAWVAETDTGWCGCYDDNSSNCTTYGRLYQWSAAMDGSTVEGAQGICPSGWHLPSGNEFISLRSYLGGSPVAGGKLKQAGTATWFSPNAGATNESGFNALSTGALMNYSSYVFENLGVYNFFWTSSSDSEMFGSLYVVLTMLSYNYPDFTDSYEKPDWAVSVRCLKN